MDRSGIEVLSLLQFYGSESGFLPEGKKTDNQNKRPEHVLGFLAASILFSLLDSSLGKEMSGALIDQGAVRGGTRLLRGWFFALSFAAIGLSTNFRELAKYFKGGKPLILYVCGQSFNLVLTLTMAYIMFYLVFPEITAKI